MVKRLVCLFILLRFLLVLEFIIKHDGGGYEAS